MMYLKSQRLQTQRTKTQGTLLAKNHSSDDLGPADGDPKTTSLPAQHFRLLFKTMLQGVVFQDAAGRIIAMNPAAAKILGKPPSEIMGKTSMDVERYTLREDGSRFPGIKHPSMVALQTGRQVRDVVMGVYNPREKSYRWININAVPLFHPGESKPYQVYTIFDDITGRKQTERALRESEARFDLMARSLDDVLYGVEGRSGEFQYVSPAFQRLLGYRMDDIIQMGGRKKFLSHVVQNGKFAQQEKVFDKMRASHRAVAAKRWESWWRCKNGSLKFIEDRWIPYYADGRLVSTFGVLTDVTARKKAEAALKTSESALRQAQRLAAIGSWEWDVQSGRHAWSDEIYRIYGRDSTLPPAVYPEVKQYFTPESWARLAAAVEKGLADGSAYECDAEVVRPDGSHRWITARGQATRGASGTVSKMHGTIQDITDRKRAEELISHANRTLRAIRACHEAMLRLGTESELLNEVCRVIVETGGERMAWVGFARNNRGKTIQPVASAGFSKTYVARARITWADTPRGRGPVGTAIRMGKVCICRDTMTDPAFLPWREYARKCGYGSMIALPLIMDKKCFGALCIYAPQPDGFDNNEQLLFSDLANDLSFGIAALRLRAERERLESEILYSIEREQERIGRDLHDGLCQMLVGAKYRAVYLEKILGSGCEEAAAETRTLEKILNHTIEQTRDLARGLNPVKASPDGLELALQRLAEHAGVESGAGPRCFCRFPNHVQVKDHNMANQLYRIAQEAVQNAVKHAAAKNISITLDQQGRQAQLIVKDDGKGLPPNLKRTGMGLENMRTRAALLGGTLEIRRRKHGGTAVTCSVAFPVSRGTRS